MIEETIRALIESSYKNTYIGDCSIDIDDCQWIRANAGRSDVHFDKQTYDYPKYTIYVRARNNADAKNRVEKIYHILNNYVGQGFVILTDTLPRYNGRDAKDRAIYSFRVEYQLGGY